MAVSDLSAARHDRGGLVAGVGSSCDRPRAVAVSRWLAANSSKLLWIVVALGGVLRLARYLDDRSLWLDEALLAINVSEKPLSDLFGRLEFLQSAPPGFLLLEKGAVVWLGNSELTLRLLPLCASLAALVLFAVIVQRLLPPAAALLALALFATNPFLLYQAAEVKPYSSDVALALLLVALALRADARGGTSLRSLVPLALAAPVAVWISFPAIIVLAAIAAALALRALVDGSRRRLVAVGALGATWLSSFGLVYAIASANVSRTADALFGAEGLTSPNRLVDVVHKWWSVLVNPGGFQDGTNGLAALLFLVGLFAFALRWRFAQTALVVLPVAFAALAELSGKYPLGERFSLFLVPFLIVLVAAGAALAVSTSQQPLAASTLIVVFLAAPPLARAVEGVFDPPRREHVKPLLQQLARDWQPGDALYVYRNSQYALRYYSTCECEPLDEGAPWPTSIAAPAPAGEQFTPALVSVPPTVLVGRRGEDGPRIIEGEVRRLPPGRVWLLFSHVSDRHGLNEETLFLALLAKRGTRLDALLESGASLYLYELTD